MGQIEQIQRRFKSQPVNPEFSNENIDAEKGIIRNIVMCQAGPAKGHGVHLEEEFIEDLVNFDQANFAEIGLKARFGHPALSDTVMGRQLGTFKNFRKEGGKAVADLHLLKSADKSPSHPKMAEWVLSMAEERPDFMMSSIVCSYDFLYQYNPETGDREELNEYDGLGRLMLKYEEEKVFAKLGNHYYTDLVEQGAATDNLFSAQFNSDKFAIIGVDFLNDHPQVKQFLQDNPHKLIEFAEKCGIPLPKPSFEEKFKGLKEFLFGKGKEIDLELFVTKEEHGQKLQELTDQLEESNTLLEAAKKANKLLTEQLEEGAKKIKELEQLPAKEHADGEKESGHTALRPYEMNPINKRAKKLANQK
jgi:hypothetical protein